MSVCIYDIHKNKITSPKIGFFAPVCTDCVVSYLLTTQNYSIKIIPDFQNVTVIDLDANTSDLITLEAFCTQYFQPLDALVLCTGLDKECSVQQIINDIQIYKMDTQEDADDVVYQNDRLDHGQTCNSVHWHYQRTLVTVNKNSPLLCNLSQRSFACCYLAKARFTQMSGLNLDTLCLCQNQYVTDITEFCTPGAVGILPWCTRIPDISTTRLKRMSSIDWYVGVFAFILIAIGLVVVYTRYRDRVCYT